MYQLRDYIKRDRRVWIVFIVPALVIMLGLKQHIHVYAGHVHSDSTHQHVSQDDVHEAHLDFSIHDEVYAEHPHHSEPHAVEVNVTPEVLNKYFSTLVFFALLATALIFLIAPLTQAQRFKRQSDHVAMMRWRNALSPQLRAPPN